MPGKSSDQRRALDALNAAMLPVLEAAGAEFIDPDIIQPADVFLERSGEHIRSRTYLFTSPDGEELCLRPDLTVPACRYHLEAAVDPAQPARVGDWHRRRSAPDRLLVWPGGCIRRANVRPVHPGHHHQWLLCRPRGMDHLAHHAAGLAAVQTVEDHEANNASVSDNRLRSSTVPALHVGSSFADIDGSAAF